jgi:hypothetical protein
MTKTKLSAGLDVAQDFLVPFGGARDVFPVHPGLFSLVGEESVAEFGDEVLVFAGIRDENLCHEKLAAANSD